MAINREVIMYQQSLTHKKQELIKLGNGDIDGFKFARDKREHIVYDYLLKRDARYGRGLVMFD
jgi:predicted signal transduction protein with EAL and GGDEF domain